LDARAGELKGELWRGLYDAFYDYNKKSQILNLERSQFIPYDLFYLNALL